MAYEELLKCITVPANTDLTLSQYCFVTVNSSGRLALTGAGLKADGVLQTKPAAAGDAAALAVSGVSKVLAGGVITAGDDVAVGTSGKAVTAASGDIVIGRALTGAGADGVIFSMLLAPSYEPLA